MNLLVEMKACTSYWKNRISFLSSLLVLSRVRLSLDENNYALDTNLCAINHLFYHKLYGRNNADYSFIFNSETDGKWPDIAYLDNQ